MVEKSYDWDFFMFLQVIGASLIVFLVLLSVLIVITQINFRLQRRRVRSFVFKDPASIIIGFFHPFCDGGAGGERVLYQAIQSIQNSSLSKKIQIVIYSGSNKTANQIINHVKDRFGLEISTNNLVFASLKKSNKLKPENYPTLTMLWQAFYSVVVCCEAMQVLPCDIFIDTMGVGYAYPYVKLFFGPKIIAYTHYPLVSFDMLKVVTSGQTQYNNNAAITRSFVKSNLKKIYYAIMTYTYTFSGKFVNQIATNSSWTNNHILQLWKSPHKTQIIYPPCDTRDIVAYVDKKEQEKTKRENLLISFAQFRPEKEHELQLKIWKKAKQNLPQDSKFIMIGTVRDKEDEKIVEQLQALAEKEKIEDSVEFMINKSRKEIIDIFARAKAAIHTMKYEHFGIAIVELMAAGIITIAHNSAGPKEDIIGVSEEPLGYLAENLEEYALFVERAIKTYDNDYHKMMRKQSRMWVQERFGIETFNEKFIGMLSKSNFKMSQQVVGGFFAKKQAQQLLTPDQTEQQKPVSTPVEFEDIEGVACKKHRKQADMICECRIEPICENCLKDHQGMEHKKIFFKDVSKTFPTMVQKSLSDADNFYGNYSSSLTGRFFLSYLEFFDRCIEADPFMIYTPALEQFMDTKSNLNDLKNKYNQHKKKENQDYLDYYKEFNQINEQLIQCKEHLFNEGKVPDKVYEIDFNRDKIRSEVKAYIDAVLVSIFKSQLMQTLDNPLGMPLPHTQLGNKKFLAEPVFDADTEFIFPDTVEDFNVKEGQNFKGHKGSIRNISKITHQEFAACDDSGQIIIWNKRENKMKGFSLREVSPIVEPIMCLTFTEDKGQYLVGGLKKGHLILYNRLKGGKKLIQDAVKKNSDIVAACNLELLNSKYFAIQDSRYYIRMYSADSLYYDLKEDQQPRPLLEIPQKAMRKEDEIDIYFGDNKLLELSSTDFASNKGQNITFILSCVATQKVVNLYVIDGIQTKCFCCITSAPIEWNYQHLRSIKFQHSPTSALELSHNRIAVATGLEIEIIDIHNEAKPRLVLEGHEERIRSLTLMSRKTKVLAKSKRMGTQEIIQNTDFVISTGDDKTVRLWKIPPPISSKQVQRLANGEEVPQLLDEEYCILNIETQHADCIYSICYLHESIATGSKDGTVKVYNLDLKFIKKKK